MNIAEIVEKQHRYFLEGNTLSLEFRLATLVKLRSAVRDNEGEILQALYQDLHKSEFEAYLTEIGIVLDELADFSKNLPRWIKPQRVKTPMTHFPAKSTRLASPYGVTLILSPWNYPFQLCVMPLIGALGAGNTAVLKPSNSSPHTSALLAKLIGECFPPEYVAVVEGGHAANAALLDQPFDNIFYTGGTKVGRVVMEAAARQLTPVTLELGGKSPCIVAADADLKLAAKRIAFGKFLNAGQTCVAPDYVLVHESVQAPFLAELQAAVRALYPNEAKNQQPHIINAHHFERLTALMAPETVLYGGRTDPENRWIEPTLLSPVGWDAPIMQEEIFGPLLPILTFTSIDALIQKLNRLPHPLALYLFTRSGETESQLLHTLSFGGACVNDTVMHIANRHLPFGGVGDSGMGQYHGKCSFDTFSHTKSILKSAGWLDLPVRYPPYTSRKLNLLRRMMKLTAGALLTARGTRSHWREHDDS